jgi:CelD/BcsL family acetyltransferase involved in cellulose biosynthesis
LTRREFAEAALISDEQVLATHWGCIHQRRFLYLVPCCDAAWGKLSPGRLLLDRLVEWRSLQGLREFDFTIGDERYSGTFLQRQRWVVPADDDPVPAPPGELACNGRVIT